MIIPVLINNTYCKKVMPVIDFRKLWERYLCLISWSLLHPVSCRSRQSTNAPKFVFVDTVPQSLYWPAKQTIKPVQILNEKLILFRLLSQKELRAPLTLYATYISQKYFKYTFSINFSQAALKTYLHQGILVHFGVS